MSEYRIFIETNVKETETTYFNTFIDIFATCKEHAAAIANEYCSNHGYTLIDIK